MDEPVLKYDSRRGVWCIPIRMPGAVRLRLVSTGENSKDRAAEVVREAGAAQLVTLENIGALTAQTIALVTGRRKLRCSTMIEEWGRYLRVVNHGQTPILYVETAARFMRFAGCEDQELSTVGGDMIDSFVNDPEVGLAGRKLRLAALRQLYKWANAKGYIPHNESVLVRVNHRTMTLAQMTKKPKHPFTEEEYQTAMKVLPQFWRWATALAYWTGMRMIDVCCLEKDSLLRDEIVVITKKRGVRIALPLDDPLIGSGELRQVIAEVLAAAPPGIYCFPDERDKILCSDRRWVSWDYIELLRTLLGMRGRSFHSLRHSCATRLARAGRTLEEIGRVLGHVDTSTTSIYVHREVNDAK